MNLQPTLRGVRLELRPLRAEDFEPLHAVGSDPLIWEQHPESNRYEREMFRKYFDKGLGSRAAFAIVDLATGALIGSTRFYDYKPELREIALGYTFLSRSHWSGGWNREMKDLLLEHAFQFVDSVVLHIGRENLRSRRAAEKIGAIDEGYVAQFYLQSDGVWRGSCIYRIQKPAIAT